MMLNKKYSGFAFQELLGIVLIIAVIVLFFYLKANTINKTSDQSSSEITKTYTGSKATNKKNNTNELPNFGAIKNVKEKKKQFFAFLRPSVDKQNSLILSDRKKLLAIKNAYLSQLSFSDSDEDIIRTIQQKYRMNTDTVSLANVNDLLVKVDEVPAPLVLVQAANESAWGTSRFAKQGLNFFGMWCFEVGCGIVPLRRDKGAKHEVARFNSVEQAVTKYLYNINNHRAYKSLRKIRANLRDNNLPLQPKALAKGLLSYSERGQEYVNEITLMLEQNKQYF